MSKLDVAVLGSLNLDVVLGVQAFPAPGETILSRSLVHAPGGKGANQALAAARIGARTAMIGAVGEDAAADILMAALTDNGVDTALVQRLPGPSGMAHILVDAAGQNLIVVTSGANAQLSWRY